MLTKYGTHRRALCKQVYKYNTNHHVCAALDCWKRNPTISAWFRTAITHKLLVRLNEVMEYLFLKLCLGLKVLCRHA